MREIDHPRILLGSKVDDAVLRLLSTHEALEPAHKFRVCANELRSSLHKDLPIDKIGRVKMA